jgi:hypothetical protein
MNCSNLVVSVACAAFDSFIVALKSSILSLSVACEATSLALSLALESSIFMFVVKRWLSLASMWSSSRRSVALMSPILDDMGWPDLLVSDAMVMMAADDCRG